MRTLIFGPMPEEAIPQSHLASGPWCFAGREECFPGWDGTAGDERAFPLPPDPFPDAASIDEAAKTANAETFRLIEIFGKALDGGQNKGPSRRFWHMTLGPFLLLAAHMLVERQKRVFDLIALYGDMPLRVLLLPSDAAFSFKTSLEFMIHGVQNVHFNHYVYSRIVEALAPPSWQLRYQPATALYQAEREPNHPSAAGRCKEALRKRLLRLPFPYLKGFSLWQTLALSLAVMGNKRRIPDRTLDFSLYCGKPLTWHFPAEPLISACIPQDIRKAALPALSAPASHNRPGPLRGMSPAYTQDDNYRLYLAGLLEQGCRLFSVQHGANYGNLQSIGGLPFEYERHAFFTWGWKKHESAPSNAQPLPHPTLASLAGKHKERAAELILVGTEMSSFSYRLKSRTQSKAMLAYRAAKLAFLRSVSERLEQDGDTRILYRPYFKTAGGLDDEAYVLRHLPHISLCKGDLTARLLGCRLLVLDHYGTTLHTAFAADVPVIAFWKSEDWGFDAESARAADMLRKAGILFETPWEAAGKALAVWPDVRGWWRNAMVRSARALWMERYARVGDAPDQAWGGVTLTRRWCTALRNC